ncbi:MAG: aminotransferase class V-fold PLP-dependent enzyme [Candidatus Liptonbacteria bacterium]|nr:aminotransferase class V-fold PLP-dependent enzyme [Candidatus Liptonbacteria bacterium]
MVHGSQFIDKTKEKNLTLPNILNVCFPNHLAETLLTKLDIAGLAVSAGSACRSRAVESSYVIEALGYPGGRAKRSVRFSFGRQTTDEEVRGALDILRGNL